jgi:hypothetical protein
MQSVKERKIKIITAGFKGLEIQRFAAGRIPRNGLVRFYNTTVENHSSYFSLDRFNSFVEGEGLVIKND